MACIDMLTCKNSANLGIASDIKKPGAHELVYRSSTDHVVGPASMRALRAGVPEGQLTVRECADSYHVATLDNDAEAIFEGSATFIQAVTAGNITLT